MNNYFYFLHFNRFYTTSSHLYTYPEHHYYDPHEICHACPLFQYSLPLIICVQMIVAMVLFVLFKWKWAVRAVSLQQSSKVHWFQT